MTLFYRTLSNKDQLFQRYCWLVFISVFAYLVIRAFFNEPLLDELITYSNYIQSHKPHNSDIPIDANNHLLNTYLASCTIYLFGEHLFCLRLPNLLIFIFYFISVVGILKYLNHNVVRYLGLLALTCIPFITEYFAYCRGYGLSFMFIAVAFQQLLRFIHTHNSNAFIIGVPSAALAAMANLNVISLSLFLFGYFFIISFGKKPLSIRRILIQRVLPTICYLGMLSLMIAFSFQLKKGGALYWGGQNGSEDRLSTAFYATLRAQLTEKDAILCDSQLSVPLLDKQLRGKKTVFIASADLRQPTHSDIWITHKIKVKPSVWKNYHLIASDPASGVVALRKNKPSNRKLLASVSIGTEQQHENVYDLMKRRSIDLASNETIALEIWGHWKSPDVTSNLELRVAAIDTNGKSDYFTNTPLRMFFQNRKIDEDFRINLKLDDLKTAAKEFLVYFWSPSGEQLVITHLHYNLYVINNNYGTR
ncbi:MAG: hypothetical protein HYZ43_08025 [Flavobacteriia bacterium]|nr:hypothetical protein [Flavobacteriia bacterium]